MNDMTPVTWSELGWTVAICAFLLLVFVVKVRGGSTRAAWAAPVVLVVASVAAALVALAGLVAPRLALVAFGDLVGAVRAWGRLL